MLASHVHAPYTPFMRSKSHRFSTPFKMRASKALQPNLAASNLFLATPCAARMLLWFLSMLASNVHAVALPTHPSPIVKVMLFFCLSFLLLGSGRRTR